MAKEELLTELKEWLDANWSPDLTVEEWWERLGLAGWSAPTLPADCYGKDASPSEAGLIYRFISDYGALGPPSGLGLLLAAPTIVKHGTREQIDRYVRDIVTGKKAWCQLFSEPGSGSDLASVQTRAEWNGEHFVVNGQKVWTSGGQYADYGMLLARTDPEVPKHRGITYFAFDMNQPGVEVRPLREMTGRSLFNEVFITDAVATEDQIIGGLNNGWAVANTTLSFEREGLGAGGTGGGAPGSALPGTKAGHLKMRAGDLVPPRKVREGSLGGTPFGAGFRLLLEAARRNGTVADPLVRQGLAKLYTLEQLGRFMIARARGGGAASVPGLPNIGKLTMSDIVRLSRDLGLKILGMAGTLHGYTPEDRDALVKTLGNDLMPLITEAALFAQAPPIYGGTDQIQKNILGERVLGLPREPSQDREIPFKDLPKNAMGTRK
jgi:alkylation response protein AidB-like acyl-CoA dehydrogenase